MHHSWCKLNLNRRAHNALSILGLICSGNFSTWEVIPSGFLSCCRYFQHLLSQTLFLSFSSNIREFEEKFAARYLKQTKSRSLHEGFPYSRCQPSSKNDEPIQTFFWKGAIPETTLFHCKWSLHLQALSRTLPRWNSSYKWKNFVVTIPSNCIFCSASPRSEWQKVQTTSTFGRFCLTEPVSRSVLKRTNNPFLETGCCDMVKY